MRAFDQGGSPDEGEELVRYIGVTVLAVSFAFGLSGCSSGPGKATPMEKMEPMEMEPVSPVLSELALAVLQPPPGPDGTYSVQEGEIFEVEVNATPAPEAALEVRLAVEVPEYMKDHVRNTYQATDSNGMLVILLTVDAMAEQTRLSIQTPDDQTDRADATFTVELLPADHYTLSEDRSATITVTDNDEPAQQIGPPQTRTLTHNGGGTVTWGDSDGPPTDGSLTKVTLTGISSTTALRVDRGGAVSCTMNIDASENPGNTAQNIDPGEVRLFSPTTGWRTLSTANVTFDQASDQVTFSHSNGDLIRLNIRVTC